MSDTSVDLRFLAKQIQTIMSEMRLIRKDCSDARQLASQSLELALRRERRELELRDDLEMMLKIELGGTVANIRTVIDDAISRVESRIVALDDRLTKIDDAK